MTDPDRWWVFQPRRRGRRGLTPIGTAWTLGAYLGLGLLTAAALGWLVAEQSPAGPVLLALLLPLGWTLLRVGVDGCFLRLAAWFAGAGAPAVLHLLAEQPACGTLVFGGGLPGISPGAAPCLPHQDFMAVLFVGGWVLFGPLAAAMLAAREAYRWRRLRRDPLWGFQALAD